MQTALKYDQCSLFDFLVDKHLKGSRLEINGRCQYVTRRVIEDYKDGKWKCCFRLTKAHGADCRICSSIIDYLRERTFYLERYDAWVEEARRLWPLLWCIDREDDD